jgi:hypothetical protein
MFTEITLSPDKDPKDHPMHDAICKGIIEGRVEVNCPWWHKDHWEAKTSIPDPLLFEGCTYRLFDKPFDRPSSLHYS